MTIAELGSIGEFVGSMAVLVTLVYLAIQTRISRSLIQSQTIALSAGTTANGAYLLASSPAAAVAWTKGIDGVELSQEEYAVFRMLLLAALVSFDGTLLSSRDENHEAIAIWRKAIKSYWKAPAFRTIWKSGYVQTSMSALAIDFVERQAEQDGVASR